MSVFGKDEVAINKFAASMPLPVFDVTSFSQPVSLSRAKIAIVTTAALHRLDEDGFELGDNDAHFEKLPRNARDLAIGHHSVNFDRGGFAADINVVYPIDRLEEMRDAKIIGNVADHHYAFAGNQSDTVSEIREVLRNRLVASLKVTFQHEPHNGLITLRDLLCHILSH